MSSQITTAFVQQYSSNVFHLAQQKGSRLRSKVRIESQVGKSGFYDRIGKAVAQLRVSRHADTPQIDTPHSRRMVTLADYEYADLIDDQDKVRLLLDPSSEYSMAAMWAMGRAMDDVIVDALGGSAYSGETGATAVPLPTAQKKAAHDGTASPTGTPMNVRTLRLVKSVLDAADVDESIPRHFVLNSHGFRQLLGTTEVGSFDYNSVKSLVNGEVDTFMGFKFVRTERLDQESANVTYNTNNGTTGSGTGTLTAANSRIGFAWAEDGILMALGKDMKARIDERADKSYAVQVYTCMSIGATRLEEEKVVQCSYDETL